MNHKIDASSLLRRRFLKVKEKNVQFYGESFWGGRNFRYAEIDTVLLSPRNELSFQVGNEVFTIETREDKPKHQAAIAALLHNLEQSRAARAT